MSSKKVEILSKETVNKVNNMADSPRKKAILKDLQQKQKGEVKK